jgi:6-phosphogluconolactonase (cycloisomerase 2 family)
MIKTTSIMLAGLLCLSVASDIAAQEQPPNTGLRLVDRIKRDDLLTANSTAVSPDGKFVYVAAWSTSTACVFRRNTDTGTLEHVQSITDPPTLFGVSALRVSPDGRLVAGACGSAKSVPLFTRDAEKGTLTPACLAQSDLQVGLQLDRQSDVAFSPDSKFLYSLDRSGKVQSFRITEAAVLEFIQEFSGPDGCLINAVGIAIPADGSAVFVVAADSSALTVAKRDRQTGKLSLDYILRDEQDGIQGFSRVYGVCVSPDDRFVYTCSSVDNAITCFRRGEQGRLAVFQEFVNDSGPLKDFVRGNEIAMTPDGRFVVSCAAHSGSLACFDRDPATGELTYRGTQHDEGSSAPMGDGATGIAFSPDGRFLYVAVAQANMVSVYERITQQREK